MDGQHSQIVSNHKENRFFLFSTVFWTDWWWTVDIGIGLSCIFYVFGAAAIAISGPEWIWHKEIMVRPDGKCEKW
jgi:hypothetical protein